MIRMEYSITSQKKLRNGVRIPIIGLGTWLAKGKECTKAVLWALEEGYRHIDTASYYGNEQDIRKALERTEVPREDIFITSKLWNSEHGYESAFEAIDKSLQKLNLDYLDLYLIHWPVSGQRIETWKAMEKILEDGKARAIGVSNYMIEHLEEIFRAKKSGEISVIPVINQVEANPFMYREDLHDLCKKNEIQLEGYSPLARTQKFDNALLKKIAEELNKSPAQIMLRWGIQKDIVVIPKSTNHARIRENMDVFDFEISDENMEILDSLNEMHRVTTWDPKHDKMFN